MKVLLLWEVEVLEVMVLWDEVVEVMGQLVLSGLDKEVVVAVLAKVLMLSKKE